ncbi:MAG: Co2+/Mg2+ efflux protein ApaG [Saprospiraceae bacterium]
METLITRGIKVSVETQYQPAYSRPLEMKYVFSYHITIENMSEETVQLLRRHWYIFDSNGVIREVEGEGVIGKQPILHPGESHEYASWSPLMTEMGKMYGFYLFVRQSDDEQFKVQIPEFQLLAPFKLN